MDLPIRLEYDLSRNDLRDLGRAPWRRWLPMWRRPKAGRYLVVLDEAGLRVRGPRGDRSWAWIHVRGIRRTAAGVWFVFWSGKDLVIPRRVVVERTGDDSRAWAVELLLLVDRRTAQAWRERAGAALG